MDKYSGLMFTDEQIGNSLHQQVMSVLRPDRFPVFKNNELWSEFTPFTQLEKIIYANLKKHLPEMHDINEVSEKINNKLSKWAKGTNSIPFRR